MQPKPNPPRPRPMSAAAVADPEARRVIEDQQRQLFALREELERLRPAPPGPDVTVQVLCEARDAGGRTRLMARKLVLAAGTRLTAPFIAGEVEAGGGGSVTNNITRNVTEINNTITYSGAFIICGSLALSGDFS